MARTLYSKILHLAASLPKGSPERRELLAALRPTMPRDFYLPPQARGTDPIVPPGTDLAIWRYDDEKGRLYGIAFAGKQSKPLWHYRFMSESNLERQIKETTEDRKRVLERQQTRQKERQEFQHGLNVGDILYSSWGYDQTNVDFYQVTKVLEKAVEIREISQKVVKSEMTSESVVAVPNSFAGPPKRKIPQGHGGNVSIKITSYAYAYPWDGKPKHQTAAGFGH